MQNLAKNVSYLDKFTVRKMQDTLTQDIDSIPDSLDTWIALLSRSSKPPLGKPQLFPEQGLEQAKKHYLSFNLGTNN